jgi:membrane protein DedA with SNARE-associated domain
MRWNTFFLYSVLGGMVWVAVVVLAGYFVSKWGLPR